MNQKDELILPCVRRSGQRSPAGMWTAVWPWRMRSEFGRMMLVHRTTDSFPLPRLYHRPRLGANKGDTTPDSLAAHNAHSNSKESQNTSACRLESCTSYEDCLCTWGGAAVLPELPLRHALLVLMMWRLYHWHVNTVEAVIAQLSVSLRKTSGLASTVPLVTRLIAALWQQSE